MAETEVDQMVEFLSRQTAIQYGERDDRIESDKKSFASLSGTFQDMWVAAGEPPQQLAFAFEWFRRNVAKDKSLNDMREGLLARALKTWPSLLREAWYGKSLARAMAGHCSVVYSKALDHLAKLDYVLLFPDGHAMGIKVFLDSPEARHKAVVKDAQRTYGQDLRIHARTIMVCQEENPVRCGRATKDDKNAYFWGISEDKLQAFARQVIADHEAGLLTPLESIGKDAARMISQAKPISTKFSEVP